LSWRIHLRLRTRILCVAGRHGRLGVVASRGRSTLHVHWHMLLWVAPGSRRVVGCRAVTSELTGARISIRHLRSIESWALRRRRI